MLPIDNKMKILKKKQVYLSADCKRGAEHEGGATCFKRHNLQLSRSYIEMNHARFHNVVGEMADIFTREHFHRIFCELSPNLSTTNSLDVQLYSSI